MQRKGDALIFKHSRCRFITDSRRGRIKNGVYEIESNEGQIILQNFMSNSEGDIPVLVFIPTDATRPVLLTSLASSLFLRQIISSCSQCIVRLNTLTLL